MNNETICRIQWDIYEINKPYNDLKADILYVYFPKMFLNLKTKEFTTEYPQEALDLIAKVEEFRKAAVDHYIAELRRIPGVFPRQLGTP